MRSQFGRAGFPLLAVLTLPILTLTTSPMPAQDERPATQGSPGNEPLPFDPRTAEDGGLGMPTPYDKFVALDQALGKTRVNWQQSFARNQVDVDVDEIAETKIALPTLLGFRISDGVMAIKAHDAEFLNKCAADIETMAKKLGLGDTELARAKKIRASANAGEWLKVFMDLGFLQQDIMRSLGRSENRAQGTLVIAGGWLQGARYVTSVLGDNYTPDASNVLREPMLVGALLSRLQALPDASRKAPVVRKMISSFQEIKGILDIRLDGSVPPEKVARIHTLASEIVTTALEAAKQ